MSVDIQENISLKDFSHFKIGGDARYFCCVSCESDVKEALDFAKRKKIKVFVMGNASNLLISDKGFDGLAVKVAMCDFKVAKKNDIFEVVCESGVPFQRLIMDLVSQNVSGLEWGAGIPALVGGIVCNNAGAYGKSISENVISLEAFEFEKNKNGILENYEKKHFSFPDCDFSYRSSRFKKDKNFLITSIVFNFSEGNEEESRKIITENIEGRIKKQPLEYPNIGSIFKNPTLSQEEAEKLFKEYPEAEKIHYNNKFPAGFFIDKIGFKGKKIGDAMVSEKHANFIVNLGSAKAEDVVILMSVIKQKVRQRFNIQLHEEIEYVGF